MIGWIQLLDQDLLTTQCKQFTSLCRCKKYLRASVIGSKEKILVYADQYRILLAFARTLAQERDEPAIEETALKMLTRDAEASMNPENLKRFLRKGWEITR